jgi:hypothetical protein
MVTGAAIVNAPLPPAAVAGRPHGTGIGRHAWLRSLTSPGTPAPPQIFAEAQDLLPGGVNSPVRAFKSVGGGPIVFGECPQEACVPRGVPHP